MNLLKSIIPVAVFLILTGCTNANESEQSSKTSKMIKEVPDTLIHSIPSEYSKILDTISGDQKVESNSYETLLKLFETYNYTPQTWKAGLHEIPRIYVTKIGSRWGSSTTKEITVLHKKQIFFRALAPLILRANELILEDRSRLETIKSSFQENKSLDKNDQIWIQKLAKTYKVKSNGGQVTASNLDDLWRRVDVVPPSLALAQSAEESGWGTSRFAAAGNALYGQWSWGKDAMVPNEQRKELGNYGIASFESLQESICSYMLNLNTHNAYADLRNKRAELRANGEKISGAVLAEQLTKYSERGDEYVEGLKSMMDYNRLSPVDSAYLSNNPPVFVIPVAE